MRTASSGTRRGFSGALAAGAGSAMGASTTGSRRAHRAGAADVADDLLDELPVAEAGGQFRLGIALGGGVGHRGQDRDLVLTPGRLMRPGPLALAADLEPAAVGLDHRQGGPRRDPRLQCLVLESTYMIIPMGLQLCADFPRDAVDLPAADGHLGQLLQRLGRLAEGGLAGGAAGDLAEHRGAVVMGRQPQPRPLREKNPGGRPGSDTSARRSRPGRPRSRWSAARVARHRIARSPGTAARPPAARPSAPGDPRWSPGPRRGPRRPPPARCRRRRGPSSAPTSSWTRRATTFPHPSAIRSTPVRSIDDDLRKGIGGPSLDFG